MTKYGPSKSEHKGRICFSVLGMLSLVAGIVWRGFPTGPGGWETVIMATVFFVTTGLWSCKKLMRGEYPDGV